MERTRSGRIQVGLRLWRVASLAPRGLGLREVALPYMEDLFVATGENVQLAVREQCDAVFVERLTGRRSVTVLTRVGDHFALHATGVGLVLLALAEVRRTGVAVSDRQVTEDALSVACPIRDAHGDVVAALSLVVRHGTVSPVALTPALRAASRGISRALGAPTPDFRQAETA